MKFIHLHNTKDKLAKDDNKKSHLHFFLLEIPLLKIIFSLVLIILFIFIGSINKLFLITILLIAFAAFLQIYTNARDFKFDIGHIFFFSIIYARIAGLLPAALIVILSGMIPKLALGDIDEQTFVSYIMQLIFVAISVFLMHFNIILVGIALSILCFGLVFLFESVIAQKPLFDMLQDIVFPLFMNICYFVSFSGPLSRLIVSLVG